MSDNLDREPTPEEIEWAKALSDGRTRWKYNRLTVQAYALESQLDSYGTFGWELMFLDPVQHRNTFGELEAPHAYVATFKRPYWIDQPDE